MAGRAPRLPRGDRPGLDGACFAVVAARFNERISKRLLSGAMRALASAGVTDDGIEVHWVPGSFELPQAAALLARTGRYAAIVCVGCVIKGETPHFDFVAGQAAAGIQRVALETGVPATFGVITALTEAQALARSGGEVGNRGQEAAEAALEMAAFVHTQRSRSPNGGGRGGGPRRRRAHADSAPDHRGGGALRSRPGAK
jgi:6,7-dimethyl-8-ribityllumazine synthase